MASPQDSTLSSTALTEQIPPFLDTVRVTITDTVHTYIPQHFPQPLSISVDSTDWVGISANVISFIAIIVLLIQIRRNQSATTQQIEANRRSAQTQADAAIQAQKVLTREQLKVSLLEKLNSQIDSFQSNLISFLSQMQLIRVLINSFLQNGIGEGPTISRQELADLSQGFTEAYRKIGVPLASFSTVVPGLADISQEMFTKNKPFESARRNYLVAVAPFLSDQGDKSAKTKFLTDLKESIESGRQDHTPPSFKKAMMILTNLLKRFL